MAPTELAEVIKQCKDAGVSSLELHPDGQIKAISFIAKPDIPEAPKKVLTRDEELKKEQEKRNPRRDAMELAESLISDRKESRSHGQA